MGNVPDVHFWRSHKDRATVFKTFLTLKKASMKYDCLLRSIYDGIKLFSDLVLLCACVN